MTQATGRVTVKIGSEALRSKAGASLNIGGIQRDFDVTDQLESYFKEKGSVATIKATMPHFADTDLIKFRSLKNFTAFFETDTGHLYTVAKAAVATVGDLTNGEVEVTIMGDPAQ